MIQTIKIKLLRVSVLPNGCYKTEQFIFSAGLLSLLIGVL